MKTTLLKIKADLYSVFVKGNADTVQLTHVFLLLAVPAASFFFTVGRLPL